MVHDVNVLCKQWPMLNVKSPQTLKNVVYYLSVDSNILSFIITDFVLLNQITKLSNRKNIFKEIER